MPPPLQSNILRPVKIANSDSRNLAALLALALGACIPPAGGTRSAGAPTDAALDTVPAEEPPQAPVDPATGVPFLDLVRLPPDTVQPEPKPSILPFGTAWTPAVPEEGGALGVRILEPGGGRIPLAVEGSFAGRQVRFARLNGFWFGLAAVPVGVSGEQELHLRFAFADGEEREYRIRIAAEARDWSASHLSVPPRFSSPSPEALERIERERKRIRDVLDTASPDWLFEESFLPPRPVDVTSPFGQERLFNGELQSRHMGLDLRGDEGDRVAAAATGRVALAGDFYFSGNSVFLDHGRGVYTGYFHLSKIRVEEGQTVERGQLIGEVGATGRVTGPHLHWSLLVAGTSLDAGSLLRIEFP